MALGSAGLDPLFGGSFVSAAMSNPWGLQKPTTYLAMLETADGCIKFIEQKEVAREIRQMMVLPLRADSDSQPMEVLQRTYMLFDRSGPGGMILHYREVRE